MKKVILLGIPVVILGLATWFVMRGPQAAEPSKIKVESTPARLARGKYIYEVVADCGGCHSERDWKKFGAPVLAGKNGSGSVFAKEAGLPGLVAPPNISQDTEHGLGSWTDGEVLRAVREGVSRDGRALFPMMPYQSYAKMCDEDAHSLVAYLRTLPAVKHVVPATKIDFPVNVLMKSAPQPLAGPVGEPDHSNQVAYGRYLVTVSGCEVCHTRMERGEPVPGMSFAGGEVFRAGGMEAVSANLTQDVETGIGSWTEQRFLEKFMGYRNFTETNLPDMVQANFTVMPWLGFRQLSEEDLKAVFAYLRTVKPIRNKVEIHPPVASKL
jgi:mono/diheme cytochrome c family protein